MELDLPPAVFSQLRAYLEAPAPSGTAELTHHWAFYGRRNRIVLSPHTSSVRFTGGAGFDDFFEFNFLAGSTRERFRRLWKLWRGREVRRRYAQAFDATCTAGTALDSQKAIEILGAPLTPHKQLAVYYANLIHPHLATRRDLRYLEIGAGSGYLAALMRGLRQCRVTIVDLPEIIPFSYLYLSRIFPEMSVRLPHEVRRGGKFPVDVDLVFLTPDKIELIPDQSVDLAANTASFGEMLPQQIARYFGLLRRALTRDGLFFTANRVEKLMSPAATGSGDESPAQSIGVRFADYPWQPNDEDIFFGPSQYHTLIQLPHPYPQHPFMQRLCRLASDPGPPRL